MMLADQRRMLIAEEIRRRGAVRVSELTERLGVSDMTIRRDLDVLASSGLIDKVHGGATTRARQSTDEPGFEAKSERQFREKEAIARPASSCSPGRRSRSAPGRRRGGSPITCSTWRT
jgi:DeoR/GlpR family transcriptional regulator of sugar metabolism